MRYVLLVWLMAIVIVDTVETCGTKWGRATWEQWKQEEVDQIAALMESRLNENP